jgi:thiol-disulfide isomerase/thioredoxin
VSPCTAFAAAIAVLTCAACSPGPRTHSGLDGERDRRGEAALPIRGPLGGEFHLAAETLAGERVEIGGPGPVRLVEVWATWCEPCALAAARARPVLARHPRVVAYAVALDVDRETVSRYVAMTPPPGTPLVLLEGHAAAARRGLDSVPTFIALDARGRVTGAITGLSPGLGPALDRLLRHAEGAVGERE